MCHQETEYNFKHKPQKNVEEKKQQNQRGSNEPSIDKLQSENLARCDVHVPDYL